MYLFKRWFFTYCLYLLSEPIISKGESNEIICGDIYFKHTKKLTHKSSFKLICSDYRLRFERNLDYNVSMVPRI